MSGGDMKPQPILKKCTAAEWRAVLDTITSKTIDKNVLSAVQRDGIRYVPPWAKDVPPPSPASPTIVVKDIAPTPIATPRMPPAPVPRVATVDDAMERIKQLSDDDRSDVDLVLDVLRASGLADRAPSAMRPPPPKTDAKGIDAAMRRIDELGGVDRSDIELAIRAGGLDQNALPTPLAPTPPRTPSPDATRAMDRIRELGGDQ